MIVNETYIEYAVYRHTTGVISCDCERNLYRVRMRYIDTLQESYHVFCVYSF